MTSCKREGDGKSPIGIWRVTAGYYRADRLIKVAGAIALKPYDGWCDDPRHGQYNRLVRLPLRASHEVLTRADCAYDMVFVTDHNQRLRVRGGGSAIFFHLIAPGATCTAGCVAVTLANMRKILKLCRSNFSLEIGMSAGRQK